VPPERVATLEQAIDRLEGELEPLRTFILPGGTQAAAVLQVARTVCRRAERSVVAAHAHEAPELDPQVLPFLNRLSDLLFVMARAANRRAGYPEPEWHPQRPDTP
jgi:cob(I)alamin adenosyltransferase